MIFWYDIETTGLDVVLDEVLELGFILTDDNLNVLVERELVVHYGAEVELMRAYAKPEVKAMHDANGLWLECADVTNAQHLSVWEVADIATETILLHCERATPAGSGVSHFDRRFVDAHMPQLSDVLSRQALDVGVVRRMAEQSGSAPWAPPAHAEGLRPHRALDDARWALDQWRHYLSLMRHTPQLEEPW